MSVLLFLLQDAEMSDDLFDGMPVTAATTARPVS